MTQDYLTTMGITSTSTLLGTITAIYGKSRVTPSKSRCTHIGIDIGSFFGAVAAFDIGERLGRKKTILLGSAIMTIGCILQASAFSPAQIIEEVEVEEDAPKIVVILIKEVIDII